MALVTALEVVRLDRTGWRVSDQSRSGEDSDRLIGYVERLERDRYEILWLGSPPGWAYVSSFQLALDAVSDRAGFAGKIRAERDDNVPVPSTPRIHRVRRRQLQ